MQRSWRTAEAGCAERRDIRVTKAREENNLGPSLSAPTKQFFDQGEAFSVFQCSPQHIFYEQALCSLRIRGVHKVAD
jgi:hypothetical protein